MAPELSPPDPGRSGTAAIAWRLAALTAMLIGEGLFLGISFDAASLQFLPPGWWRGALGAMPAAPQIGLAIAAAALLTSGPRLRDELAAQRSAIASFRRTPLVIAQLFAFVGVVLVTASLFGVVLPRTHHPGWLAVLWFACSAAALLLWVATLLPVPSLLTIARHVGGSLAAGALAGLLAWAAGRYTQSYFNGLRRPTFLASWAVLRLLDPSAHVDHARYLIGIQDFTIEISTDCSGYEGIGLVWVFLGAFLWAFRRQLRFPRVLLLLPAATAAVWVANVLRIAALVLIGAHASPAVAVGGFHSFSGLLLFCAVALATAAVAYRSPYFSKAAATAVDHPSHAATASPAPWIVPLMVMIATSLVTGLLSAAGLDPLYVVRVVTTAIALWCFRRAYPPLVDRGVPVAALAVGALVFLAWLGLTLRAPGVPIAPPFPPHSAAGIRWLFWRALGSVVIAPIAEELAFRGYLARRAMAADFTAVPLRHLSWPAIALSAVLFGALHAHFVAGCVAGLAYGWLARTRGRLSDAIAAHAATNALLVAYAVSRSAWWLLG